MPRRSAQFIILISLAAAAGFAISGLGAPFVLVPLVLAFVGANHLLRELRQLDAESRISRRAAHDLVAGGARAVAAEQQLMAIIESVTEGILQISESGRLLHSNESAREMLHLPPHADGQSITALIRNPELRWCIERAASGQSFEPAEIIFEDRQLLVSSRPLRFAEPSTNTSGAVIAIVDLTEFKRLESVRRDFVANVSHELKTPLTSIRGYTETLLGEDLPPEMQRQFLEVVQKNAERIQRIVDDLLDLSRLQSGGWRPELQSVDVALLAHDVWIGCEAAHRKPITYDVMVETSRQVLADPGGLQQVFSNLFDNAIRYTPAGGVVTVTIEPSRKAAGYVAISVADTGSGIPRDALPRVFERFYRVDAARSREAGGTGLGLAIVRHLIERMGGEVAAESELGKGTTIRLQLPAAAEI